MSLVKKILLACVTILFLTFMAQKAYNGYLNAKINEYLKPYHISAKLEEGKYLTLKSTTFKLPSLTCKIKIKFQGDTLYLIPYDFGLDDKYRPLIRSYLPEGSIKIKIK